MDFRDAVTLPLILDRYLPLHPICICNFGLFLFLLKRATIVYKIQAQQTLRSIESWKLRGGSLQINDALTKEDSWIW